MTGKNIRLQLFASSYTSRSNLSNSFPIIESFTSHIFFTLSQDYKEKGIRQMWATGNRRGLQRKIFSKIQLRRQLDKRNSIVSGIKKKNIIILKGVIVKSLFFSPPLFSQTPFRKPLNHPFLEKTKAANKRNFLTILRDS